MSLDEFAHHGKNALYNSDVFLVLGRRFLKPSSQSRRTIQKRFYHRWNCIYHSPYFLLYHILWITGINYTTIFSFSFSAKSIQSLASLGGILFLASDAIIGFEKFLGLRSKLARGLVWWLYPIGQIILISMV